MNPSSNLLIAHLGALANHPLWRLKPPAGPPQQDEVRVCIGSDDPITFATRLPEEYQLLHDALIEGGLSAAEAGGWLNSVRETGLFCRFTQPRSEHALMSVVGFDRLPVVP